MKRTICILSALLCCLFTAAGENLGLTTVVIDAGHGGKDAGCVSKDRKTYEKTLTLDIATTLADKIRSAYPEVRVVMTRSTDKYVTLNDRAEIANDAHADLFISVHINANDRTSPSGYSVHVLGQSSNKNRDLFASNMDVCMRENSVIMLEEDYSTKYQGFDPSDPESYIFMMLMQNSHREQSLRFAEAVQSKLEGGPIKVDRGVSQDPFYVLWKTSMPAVLVELGFISNSADLAQLRRKAGRDDLAERLFQAFREYKTFYDESLHFGAERQGSRQEAAAGEGVGVEYAVQILVSGKPQNDPSIFMGYTPRIIRTGDLCKYFIAVSESREETESSLPRIRKRYPDAFLVEIRGESVTRVR